MLVTFNISNRTPTSLIDDQKLSPTHFVASIRHTHRCRLRFESDLKNYFQKTRKCLTRFSVQITPSVDPLQDADCVLRFDL